jgi:hypothetical protein
MAVNRVFANRIDRQTRFCPIRGILAPRVKGVLLSCLIDWGVSGFSPLV